VYKQTFRCKINCTKVKWTATKSHKSPDETDRARSWTPDSTPLLNINYVTRVEQELFVWRME